MNCNARCSKHGVMFYEAEDLPEKPERGVDYFLLEWAAVPEMAAYLMQQAKIRNELLRRGIDAYRSD